MNGDKIPDQDHIARFCGPAKTDGEEVQATAFMLRKDETYLSVNWLESLNSPNREGEIAIMRTIYSETFNRVGAAARIAVLNVGEMRQKVLEDSPDGRNLEVLHDPLPKDLSHSRINNLRYDDETIAELILETLLESYSARE